MSDLSALPTQIDRAITEKEVAEILGIPPMTLRKMRCHGARGKDGLPPIPYFRYGARTIRYSLKEVLAWRDAKKVDQSQKAA